jgi:hypothetical protein
MTYANASATHTQNSKEHQVVMVARPDGHLAGTKPDNSVYFPAQTNAANRVLGAIFNADATKLVRIRGVWILPTQTTITGATMQYDLNKISTVGTTGATTVTPRPLDSGNAPANFTNLTFSYGYTAGATLVHQWFPIYLFNDETAASTQLIAMTNQLPTYGDTICEIVLRQNEGFEVKQIAGTVGLTGLLIFFTMDS